MTPQAARSRLLLGLARRRRRRRRSPARGPPPRSSAPCSAARFSRNMVSDEKGLPADWDVKTGTNVKWWADVGSQAYAGPVVAGGKVFVGTNNDGLRNPALPNDRGVVMAFARPRGEFLWQMTHEKLASGRVNDWPQQGVCSTPFVEGKRLYYVSNRATVVRLDTEGLKDGNDGPSRTRRPRARPTATSSGSST